MGDVARVLVKSPFREADALVTRVMVQNHQSVHRGDPLVEVVERPQWISRYLVMHQMQSLLDALDRRRGQQSTEGSVLRPGTEPAVERSP